jgi:hypothetical protein
MGEALAKHNKNSGVADGADATKVRPQADWNDKHIFTGGVDGNMPVYDGSVGSHLNFLNFVGVNLTNRTGGGVVAGDVCAASTANDNSAVLDDTVNSFKKFYVAQATIADATAGLFGRSGPMTVKSTGTINRGEYVRKSATTKAVETTGVTMGAGIQPPVGSLGVALSAAAGGFVTVDWFGFTVGVWWKGATPSIRLTGTEASAKDVLITENAGILSIQRNDGTEGSPTWTDILKIDLPNNKIRPTGQLRLDLETGARLVLPSTYAT